jgi:creatinine amidohydrolase
MELTSLTWTDVEEYLGKCRTVILPLGAVEQHGPALPLGTDAIIAEALAREIGTRTGRLVGPVLSPGLSLTPHMNFAGSISLHAGTFTAVVMEVVGSLHHHGFRNFLLVNGHGGNDGCIQNAMVESRYRLDDLKCRTANWWRLPAVEAKAMAELGRPVGHGCAMEASLVWHIDAGLVRPDRFGREMRNRAFLVSNNLAGEYTTRTGLMDADQAGASPELGREVFELAVEAYAGLLAEMEES